MKFSKIMLGTVQFGLAYGINNSSGKPDDAQIDAILRTAADGGINVLDTARNYGDSEERLGAALRRTGLEKHFHIITKVKLTPADLPATAVTTWIADSVRASLAALGRDTVDGLLLHAEKDLPWFDELHAYRTRGIAGFVGASLDSIAGRDTVDTLPATQVPGNILDRRFEAYARRNAAAGNMVFVRSVYLQGLLFKPADQLRGMLQDVLPIRTRLETLAGECGITPAELYFRYLLGNPDYTSVLSGVDTPAQLRENIRIAAAGALDDATLAAIRAIVPELPETIIRPSLWPR